MILKPIFPFPSLHLNLFAAFALLGSSLSFGEIVLVSHDFGGLNTDTLNGKTATVFSTDITSAGGSSTWVASNDFNADGTMSGGGSDAARLHLGSYINDSMGSATGKFSLTATLNPSAGGGGTDFLSLGYFTGPIGLGDDFASDSNKYAIGTAITRRSSTGISEYYAGPRTDNSFNPINGVGTRTYTIDFDFTPASGYDEISNFGTITFHSDNDGGSSTSYILNSAKDIQYIGITRDDDVAGIFSDLEFTQIPEPSSLFLLIIAGMGLAIWRRR